MAGISYQDVADAVIKLQGLEKNTTVDNVRAELGTGSKSTITRHLRAWKETNNQAPQNSSLPTELQSITQGLWERLQGDAQQKITQHQEEAAEREDVLQEQLRLAQQQTLELIAKNEQLSEQLQQQFKNNEELQKTNTALEIDKIKLQEQSCAQEKQITQEQNENHRLHQLLKHMQDNFEHYQTSMQKQREEQTLLMEKQNNTFQNEKIILQDEINSQKNQILQLEQKTYQTNFDLQRFEEQHHHLQQNHLEQTQRFHENKQLTATMQERCSQLQKQLDTKDKNTTHLEKLRIDLEKKIAILISQNQTLHETNSVLEKNIAELVKINNTL